MTAIKTMNLVKRYKSITAVDDVHLEMLFVRENGYPKKIGIIAWFDFILHIIRDIVRLHATK